MQRRPITPTQPYRFAAIGDTHLTRDDFHPSAPATAAEAHDRGKYIVNVAQTVLPLLASIRAAQPELLLHSGDLVEGARGDGGRDEMAWGLDFVRQALDCPVALARGNHDPQRWFEDVVRPHLRGAFGAVAEPYAIDRGPARIVVVDSQRCGAAELDKVAELFRDATGWRILIAHSPAFNVGRPFFRDRPFADLLLQRAADLRLHMLLCGHTHNTSVVSYDTGGWPLLQVMLSSIRWGDGPAVPLAAAKTWLVPPSRQRYAWAGRLENSPPLWLLATAAEEQLDLELREVTGEVAVALRLLPDGTALPGLTPSAPAVTAFDRGRVRRGWLCLSLYQPPARPHEVRLGDTVLASFPATVPHYHHRTPLSDEALDQLSRINEVRLAGPGGELAVGSIAIEIELDDGTHRWTRPSAGIYGVGGRFADWPEPCVVRTESVAGLPAVRLCFD